MVSKSFLALLIFLALIFWLLALDRKRERGVSAALWIPTLWLLVISSRPVSQWLHPGAPDPLPPTDLDGSPIDRFFYFGIIIAGYAVLARRRLNWGQVFARNRWIFVFYAFLALTSIWSADPFVSLKRLIKDFGNVVMILVVLTERNPITAVKSLLSRCTYVLLPLSVLFIQYFPALGRGYTPFTWEPCFTGVTSGKNTLGEVLIIFGLFLVWQGSEVWMPLKRMLADFFCYERRNLHHHDSYKAIRERRGPNKAEVLAWLLVISMELWLLGKTHSSTALGCFVFGSIILFLMRMPFFQRRTRHLGIWGIVIVGAVFILNSVFNLAGFFAEILGRDATLTGRTEIWDRVLHSQTNPILGEGFWIFWDTEKATNLFSDYFFRMPQSHNGYIEMYLDGGLVAVSILVGLVLSFLCKAKTDILRGDSFGILYLLFALAPLIYNYTEAAFARLTLVWFAQLLAGIQVPLRRPARVPIARPFLRSDPKIPEAANASSAFLRS